MQRGICSRVTLLSAVPVHSLSLSTHTHSNATLHSLLREAQTVRDKCTIQCLCTEVGASSSRYPGHQADRAHISALCLYHPSNWVSCGRGQAVLHQMTCNPVRIRLTSCLDPLRAYIFRGERRSLTGLTREDQRTSRNPSDPLGGEAPDM